MKRDDWAAQSTDLRAVVLETLRRHGRATTSFQVLEPGFSYWFDGDACVAYVDTGSAWVVASAPIAEPSRCAAVAQRFVSFAERSQRRVRFFAAEDWFVRTGDFSAIPIGEQPVWDPCRWSSMLAGSKSLREQLRRARAKGVCTRFVSAHEVQPAHATRSAIDSLITRWLASRSMAPMAFLVEVHPFSHADERRYFVAEVDGRTVGFLAAVPIHAREGWFIEDLLRDPTAPNGTTELLVDAAMCHLASEGARLVTLGLAPLTGDIDRWLQWVRKLSLGLYDFGGLRAFKAKLNPRAWEPVYLAFPQREHGLVAIYDSLAAFARGGLFRFGLATFLRVPDFVVRLLAAMLVPWTLLLAMATPNQWFPQPWMQWAWVAFDVVLFAGLWWLSERWRGWLATLLAWTVTLDAIITWAQALSFNLPRTHGAAAWLAVTIAVLAPTAAAPLLWRARARRRDLS